MRLKQKFFVLAGLSGLLMAIISIVGYYNAYRNLENSVEHELNATVESIGNGINGWLSTNMAASSATADILTALNGNEQFIYMKEILAGGNSNPYVMEVGFGNEQGALVGYEAGIQHGKLDKTRAWYQAGKNSDKTVLSDAYVDRFTGKLVVSAVTKYTVNGQFGGTVFADMGLDTIEGEIAKLKYKGQGQGFIFERTGNILATEGSSEIMSNIRDVEGMGAHVDEMMSGKSGQFILEATGEREKLIFAYTTIPAGDWVIGIAVPYDFVFADINNLRMTYIILMVVGLGLLLFTYIKFADSITGSVALLEERALSLADGNLQGGDVPVTSADEIGNLTHAFNRMSQNLRNLIGKMATTSQQVSASSDELTANAQQSADASVHVAETVGDVSEGMDKQLTDIDNAKNNVESVVADITAMSDKAVSVTETSVKASEAAQRGAELMTEAIAKMGNIEKSVMASAEVVKKLGENSEQIGQIVEAISSISEQTNLLSLNAAIEAARAGEHGRGFAVVADEVRKLATESQNSADEIKSRISSIQKATEEAVVTMRNGTTEVESGTTAIREVGSQFKDILSMVNGIKRQMEEIKNSAQTVAEGAKQIVTAVESIDEVSRTTAKNTQSISAATEEQSASNEEIAAASSSLAQLAADMQATIGKFKV